jgi:hypothetical protein
VSGWAELDRLLATDPRDSGCQRAMEILDVYAELLADDADAARRYPDIAAHLAQCGPCSEDLAGLLNAIHPGPV